MLMRMLMMTMEMIKMWGSLILMMMMPGGGDEGKRNLPKNENNWQDEDNIGGNHTHLRNSQECH